MVLDFSTTHREKTTRSIKRFFFPKILTALVVCSILYRSGDAYSIIAYTLNPNPFHKLEYNHNRRKKIMIRRSTRKRYPTHSSYNNENESTPFNHFSKPITSENDDNNDISFIPKDVLLKKKMKKKKKQSESGTKGVKKKLKVRLAPDVVSSSNIIRTSNEYNIQQMVPLSKPLSKAKTIDEALQTPTRINLKKEMKTDEPDLSPTEETPSLTNVGKSPKIKNRKSPSKTKLSQIIRSSDLAKLSPESPWIDLQVSPEELRPSSTLTTGQCFNWIAVQNDSPCKSSKDLPSPTKESAWGTHDATEWVGPFGPFHVLSIRETPLTTLYRVLRDVSTNNTTPCPSGKMQLLETQLKNYFQLSIPLTPLYHSWSQNDKSDRLTRIAEVILGVRVLQQDPIECLFSFICSSNNNIPRITLILSRFRSTYGNFLLELPTVKDGVPNDDGLMEYGEPIHLFSFPTLSSMQNASEMDLRDLGLGYRAKYIIQTRDLLLQRGGMHYLLSLRDKARFNREEVQMELLGFSGIGRKVADCVALFSLDRDDAIPVDVHVWHIACRDYQFEDNLNVKSLTPTVYNMVGNLFRGMFEDMAGWAHSLLFVAELPSFRVVLPKDMVKEMDKWKEIESAKKAAAKLTKSEKKP